MKLLRFPLTRIVVAVSVVLAAALGARYSSSRILEILFPGAGFPADLITAGFMIAASCFAYALFVFLIENRHPAELSPKGAAQELLCGILLGAALVAAILLLIWLAGSYGVVGRHSLSLTTPVLAAALLAGFVEEILARAVVFRIAEEVLGSWGALALSSLLFGLLHLWNPHASVLRSLIIAAEAGLLLGAAYMLTRRLWLPIGLHLSWNYTMGGIFGVPVSGHEVDGLFRAVLSGPELISGGAFGPEASIFALGLCIPAAALLLLAAKRKGNIRRPW